MPRVPRAEREIAPRAATPVFQRDTRVPRAAFGGEQGEALEQIGAEARQIGERLATDAVRQTIEDEERMAKQLDVEMHKRRREIVSQYYSLRGQNAIDGYEPVIQQLHETREELLASTDRQNVKDMFAASSSISLENEFEDMDRHLRTEREAANDAASEGRILYAIQNAADKYNDPDAIRESMEIAFAEIEDEAERKGYTEDAALKRWIETQSAIVAAAVKAAVDNEDSVEAGRLFAEFSDDIDGITRGELAKLIRNATVLDQAQILSDSAFAKFPNDPEAGRQYIRDVATGKVRDEAMQVYRQRLGDVRADAALDRALEADERSRRNEARSIESHAWARTNHMYSLGERQRKDRERQATSNLFSHIIQEGGTVGSWGRKNPEEFDVIASSDRAENILTNAQQAEIMIAEGRSFATTSDPDVYQRLREMGDTELAAEDLAIYRSQLRREDWEQIANWQSAANARLKANVTDQSVYNAAESVLADLAPSDFSWTSPNDREARQKRELINEMTAFVHNEFTSKGLKPNRQDLLRKAQQLWIPLQVPAPFGLGLWNRTAGIVAELRRLDPDDLAEARVDIDDIPTELLTTIQSDLSAYGLDPDDESLIEQVAAAFLLGDTDRIRRLLGTE